MTAVNPIGLELRAVEVRVQGRALLQDVSLALREGEFVALLGPNGAGKTTLLRAALGLVSSRGQVLLGGRDVRALSGPARAARVAWLPQHSQAMEAITALELVMAARFRFSESRVEAARHARTALTQTGSAPYASRLVSKLSGGEQQRVAVAALLAQEAPVLLLDEPANHLDPAQQIAMYELFGRVWRGGRAMLCITHDVNMLRHIGEGAQNIRVIGIADGRLRFEMAYGAQGLGEAVGDLFQVSIDEIASEGQRLLVARGRRP